MLRCGITNSETGEFISDLKALAMTQQELAQYALQKQQAMAKYAQLGQGIGGLLGGTGLTLTTANTSNCYTTGGTYIYVDTYEAQAVARPAPVKDDEFSWLRKRVEDVCWTQAA